jgi:hypothetical protein
VAFGMLRSSTDPDHFRYARPHDQDSTFWQAVRTDTCFSE